MSNISSTDFVSDSLIYTLTIFHYHIGLMSESKIRKTAAGFIYLSNILCLIENKALLAFELKFFSADKNLPLADMSTPRYLYLFTHSK